MISLDDNWFCAQGQQLGKPTLIRGRENLAHVMGLAAYNRLMTITWEYEVEDECGLPSRELNEKMARFENTVIDDLEQDLLCIFCCVYLHNGLKEWMAYTADIDATCDRLDRALASQEPYPIEITVEDNPTWAEYRNLLAETNP